ncbi:hypothetical protein D3C78_1907180 [compost metagenome]
MAREFGVTAADVSQWILERHGELVPGGAGAQDDEGIDLDSSGGRVLYLAAG